MISKKIKHNAELEYEFTLELARFVDGMVNEGNPINRVLVTMFLNRMNFVWEPDKYYSDQELLDICKTYFED